jgi:hypothetical protein
VRPAGLDKLGEGLGSARFVITTVKCHYRTQDTRNDKLDFCTFGLSRVSFGERG